MGGAEDSVEVHYMDFIEGRYKPTPYADFYNDFLDRIRSGEKKNKYKNLMELREA